MDITEVAYLAGLFDGEGTIVISTQRGHRDIPKQWLAVSISQSSPEVFRPLVERYGGRVQAVFTAPSYQKRRKRPLYHWRFYSSAAARFLELLLPYLRIKRPQALLALEFARGFVSLHNVTDRRIIDAEVKRRADLRTQLRSYTKRLPSTFARGPQMRRRA